MEHATPRFDISVIVTAHDETLVSGPAMAAADLTIQAAERAGLSVERLVVLDNADDRTQAWWSQPRLAHWTQVISDAGDVGPARNFGARAAHGRYVAFLDADDLFSENWLVESHRVLTEAAAEGKTRAIAHPELNWFFDGAHSVYWKPGQDDPLFLPQYFHLMNYYDTLCLAPRELHYELDYATRDLSNGLSFQDWQFSIESMAAGWLHLSTPNTIIFKRRRDESLVTGSRGRLALHRRLDAMRIDRVADLAGARTPKPVPTRGAHPPVTMPGITPGSPLGHRFVKRILHAQQTQSVSEAPAKPPPWYKLRSRAKYVKQEVQYPDLAAVRPWFDATFYLSKHMDILRQPNVDPLRHYLRAGEREGRTPSPLFSAKFYKARYPELDQERSAFRHWIETGWAEGKIGMPFPGAEIVAGALGLTPAEAESVFAERYLDLRRRLEAGILGEQAVKAAALEPLIEQSWRQAPAVRIPPFHTPVVCKRLAALLRAQEAAEHQPARFVICVNRPRWGGALRAEGLLAHALAALHGPASVMIVTTDGEGPLAEQKLPQGARHVDFATASKGLEGPQKQRVLAEFLRTLAPEAVFNINSRLLWDAMRPYGHALSHGTRMVAWLFCEEQTPYGHWSGYPLKQTYRYFDRLAALCTDSEALADLLRTKHMIPPHDAGRLRSIPAPVDPTIPVQSPPDGPSHRQRDVFWAGRLDPQKRPDLVYAIAEAMPDIRFRLWGEKHLDANRNRLPRAPSNIVFEGMAESFADIPMAEADAFLYTAAWDGVPQILLEVAMTGVPLVGSRVGGTPEILKDGLTASLPPDATVEQWVSAIRTILSDPAKARAHAIELRDVLIEERSNARLQNEVAALLEQIGVSPSHLAKPALQHGT